MRTFVSGSDSAATSIFPLIPASLAMGCAVEGLTCMRPTAPADETTSGRKPDSTLMTAATRYGSTSAACAYRAIALAYESGWNTRWYHEGP